MLRMFGQRKLCQDPGLAAANCDHRVVNPTWIRTPLIRELTSHPKFKDPVLEPEEVTTVVVEQVLSGRSGQLVLPANRSIVSGIRGWPLWLSTGLRNKVSGELIHA